MARKPRVPASSILATVYECARKAGFAAPAIYTFEPKD